MGIFLISFWPASTNPDPNGTTQRLANAIAVRPPWVQVSLATWAVETDATAAQIYATAQASVLPSDLLIVSAVASWETNHPALPWHQAASGAVPLWEPGASEASDPPEAVLRSSFET